MEGLTVCAVVEMQNAPSLMLGARMACREDVLLRFLMGFAQSLRTRFTFRASHTITGLEGKLIGAGILGHCAKSEGFGMNCESVRHFCC